MEQKITKKVIEAHGFTGEEYKKILKLTGRKPSWTELGIWSAMWNEHCSYKSSKKWLRTLPTQGPQIIQGPGENAGVVDIGEGDVVVFKMESHNHPSFIEPFQGAATGVGGILRDVFTMGARPIATMNALRFGEWDNERTPYLLKRVVAGIGGYANSFGVVCAGGETNFHARYNGNILVNAFAAGLAKQDEIYLSIAKGVGAPVVYLGAKTGRDGVGGASMASAAFDEDSDRLRPNVQIGDPFTEKCLMEACLELMKEGAILAIQDMGAAGLTCSAVEMGAKGDLGVTLNLDNVPIRQADMTPYEMMLSESQERMLMILVPEKEEIARKIFDKWQLDFAIVGETTEDLRFRVQYKGEEVANLPIKELGDEAPEYDRPSVTPALHSEREPHTFAPPDDYNAALLKLLGSPDLCSRRWIYEQYDTYIGGNSLQRPGGDAGVVRIDDDSGRALAFSCDVTPRYVEADPFEGGKQAVAECYRNLISVGARPLACTDNLNFGNPEKPEIMGQFIAAIEGISEACLALDMPVASGNVSFYNETSDENGDESILPTPTIGGVGLIEDLQHMATIGDGHDTDHVEAVVFLVGTDAVHLARTLYEKEILGEESGPPPPVNLLTEKDRGEFILAAITSGYATLCHDISDGGLAVALAEICMAANTGITVDMEMPYYSHAALFGEDQARYVMAVKKEWADMFAANSEGLGNPFSRIGTMGGKRLIIGELVNLEITEMKKVFENALPDYIDK